MHISLFHKGDRLEGRAQRLHLESPRFPRELRSRSFKLFWWDSVVLVKEEEKYRGHSGQSRCKWGFCSESQNGWMDCRKWTRKQTSLMILLNLSKSSKDVQILHETLGVIISESEWVTVRTEFTDVNLVSEDIYRRLYWWDFGDWWYLWRWCLRDCSAGHGGWQGGQWGDRHRSWQGDQHVKFCQNCGNVLVYIDDEKEERT